MQTYKVALFGHRDLCAHLKVEEGLRAIFEEMLSLKPYIEVYVGRNGELDVFASSVIKGMITKGRDDITLTLVLPYKSKDIEYYEKYYNDIIIPECAEKAYPKIAITLKNRWMVENSDLVICYVERENGGAYEALKYAKRLGKTVINLADRKK